MSKKLKDLEKFLQKMLAYSDLQDARVFIQGNERVIVTDIQHWNDSMSNHVRNHFRGAHISVGHSSSSLTGFHVAITPVVRNKVLTPQFTMFASVAVVVMMAFGAYFKYNVTI